MNEAAPALITSPGHRARLSAVIAVMPAAVMPAAAAAATAAIASRAWSAQRQVRAGSARAADEERDRVRDELVGLPGVNAAGGDERGDALDGGEDQQANPVGVARL